MKKALKKCTLIVTQFQKFGMNPMYSLKQYREREEMPIMELNMCFTLE